MFDLIIFMTSAGPNVSSDILIKTVSSIENNIGITNYKYYFVLEKSQETTINNMISNNLLSKDKVFAIKEDSGSWASQYNLFFDSCKHLTKYVLYSHDDLIIRTPNFFNITMDLIKGKESEIGWITFTGDFYYRELGRPWAVSARMGFAKDRGKWPYLYECHKFNSSHDHKSKDNLHLLDMPEFNRLVKIHAPYPHFNIISTKSMEIVGPCEDWTLYTHLTDEDWGLEALRNNLWNIWIPNIYYTHPTNYSQRVGGHRWTKEAHAGFTKKWGFTHGSETNKLIEEIRLQYENTLIPWSSYYNTYDWQYL